MRKHLLLPLGLAAAVLCAPLAAQTVLTLPQALAQAALNHPEVSAARREVEASEGAIAQAGAWRNPELDASVEDTRRASRTTTATLGIPIETGGKRGARVAAAEGGRRLAQAELDQVQAALAARVIEAWFAAWIAQERAALAERSAGIAARAADAVARRVAAGKVSPVEENRARVDQANAQLESAEAASELQIARFALAGLLGGGEPAFDRVAGDGAPAPQRPPLGELAARLDAAPALGVARAEAERRRALIDVERSKAVPDVTFTVGAKRDNELGRQQAIVGISVPLPLFDRNQGAVLEAARRADRARDDVQATRLRLMTELQAASVRLASARASLQLLETTVLPAAQQTYDATGIGFEAGKFGFLEVLDAQRALLQARARQLQTLATAHQAAAAIDRIAGR